MTRKILYSPGFGAGWTTWEHDPDVRALMLTYPPLVAAVEAGEKITEIHPAVVRMLADIAALGKDRPYLGGLCNISVATVSGRVHINEYDGSESVIEEYNEGEGYWQ